jgi:hypothetical protein
LLLLGAQQGSSRPALQQQQHQAQLKTPLFLRQQNNMLLGQEAGETCTPCTPSLQLAQKSTYIVKCLHMLQHVQLYILPDPSAVN